MKMQGYNGSQGWDASFTMQALAEAELVDEFPRTCTRAYAYLERTQILCSDASRASPAYEYESPPMREQFYRHVSEGGWPFSSAAHGWPISDCTAEGLKVSLPLPLHLLLRFKTQTVQFRQESYGAYRPRPAAQLLSVHPG